MLLRPLLSVMICVSLVCVLLTSGARLWGQHSPPSPLLVSVLRGIEEDHLRVTDVNRDITLNWVGNAYASSVLSGNGPLAFVSNRDGNYEIYVWDEATLRNISQNSASDFNPMWSGDGRLAFVSYRDGNSEIYVWDGEALTNISQNVGADTTPLWSTDGRLAFMSDRDNNRRVYIWDGVTLTNLTQSPMDEFFLVLWTP